jgi:hypothetical protein
LVNFNYSLQKIDYTLPFFLNAIAFSYHQGKRPVSLIREFWDTLYIARDFFFQSNTRVCRSKLPWGWRPRVILATNTRVSGLLEKISGNISVPWYIIQVIQKNF